MEYAFSTHAKDSVEVVVTDSDSPSGTSPGSQSGSEGSASGSADAQNRGVDEEG